jgi:hypothetical protein
MPLVAGSIRRWLRSAANKLQSKSSRKPRRPRNWNPVDGGAPKLGLPCYSEAQNWGPCKGPQSKRRHLLRHVEAAAQVRSGAVHAWRRTAQPQLRAAYSRLRLKQRVLRSEDRSAHLVRSFFADDYLACLVVSWKPCNVVDI